MILSSPTAIFAVSSVGAADGGGATRGTLNRALNPKSAMAKWGHKLGHAVRGPGTETTPGTETPSTEALGGAVEAEHDEPPPALALGAMTIDRVVEQLFFVRVSVYNAKGKLSEPQQVRYPG